jgi:hypothetical protein
MPDIRAGIDPLAAIDALFAQILQQHPHAVLQMRLRSAADKSSAESVRQAVILNRAETAAADTRRNSPRPIDVARRLLGGCD